MGRVHAAPRRARGTQRGKLIAGKKPHAEDDQEVQLGRNLAAFIAKGEFRAFVHPGPSPPRGARRLALVLGLRAPVFVVCKWFRRVLLARLVILFSNLPFGRFRVVELELELYPSY